MAVESDERIAEVYARLNPDDEVVVGDAHEYLRRNYSSFDFIWSSPPCQTHSKMAKATRHKERRYPDLKLYEEIYFLEHFYGGRWIVENVKPFYKPLIAPTQVVGRHLFWSNFTFNEQINVEQPARFIDMTNTDGKKALMDWLGIHYEENIYYGSNHCPAQILRNCVHPDVGGCIFEDARLIA